MLDLGHASYAAAAAAAVSHGVPGGWLGCAAGEGAGFLAPRAAEGRARPPACSAAGRCRRSHGRGAHWAGLHFSLSIRAMSLLPGTMDPALVQAATVRSPQLSSRVLFMTVALLHERHRLAHALRTAYRKRSATLLSLTLHTHWPCCAGHGGRLGGGVGAERRGADAAPAAGRACLQGVHL